MPNGLPSELNEPGLRYYDNLIDELLANNIEPMVTMFHWDLPQALEQLGGFTSSAIIWHFEQYANVLFQRYGDRVKNWITINEVLTFCNYGYAFQKFPPFKMAPGEGNYQCAHNVLIAHARTYRLYKSNYAHYNGRIGFSVNTVVMLAKNASNIYDREAAEDFMQFSVGKLVTSVMERT